MHLRVSKSPHLSLPAPGSLHCRLWICHFFLLNKKKDFFLKYKTQNSIFFSWLCVVVFPGAGIHIAAGWLCQMLSI